MPTSWYLRAALALAATTATVAAAADVETPPQAVRPGKTLTLDEVYTRYIEARGGKDKLAALKSVRFSGKAMFGPDGRFQADWSWVSKKPGLQRQEVSIQGLTAVDAWDGKDGWSVQPFQGRREPERMAADDAKELSQRADLEGPLVDYKQKGNTAEYLGVEDVDGTPAHKVRVTLKDGDVRYIYLDPDQFLEIRVVSEHRSRGALQVGETDYGSYGQVNGVWMPFSIQSGPKGGPRFARFVVERAEGNVAADDAMFHFPAAGTRVERSIQPGPAPAQAAEAWKAPPAPKSPPVLDSGVISGLGARNIGSAAMSGRIAAVAARNEKGKTLLYVGAASGGVWKSEDSGTTFKPVFDKQPVQSIGAIAIEPGNSKVVWVGTGESWTRNSVSIGDGIYKSADGGESWTNMGLRESERITRILIHPKSPDTVYACVPGKLWSDSPDRGVYKTINGGKTWSLVLKGSNLSTGCSGLTMDPKNPDALFAGLWDFRRKGWTFRSGGEGPDAASGSGLFKSADGGRTWTELKGNGLPPKPWGRVEVVIAPSDNKVVYTLVESKDSALYRSSDGGATWDERDKSQAMVWRPFYFARLIVDPTNPDRVFKPDLALVVSDDGGKSFTYSGGRSHGDWHDLWIDPENPKHIVGGDDGGFWLSYDGGSTWWKGNNLPISQFYHVTVDDKDPYRVYGGLQDNSTWVGPSAYGGGISNQTWENLYNSDGFWAQVDPTDPEVVYAEGQGGFIGRIDRRTQSSRDIQPKAGYQEKLRFNWNTPIQISPNDKSTLYIGAQFLFRSRDRGDSWERISPDLTTNDPQKQKQELSGGVTVDNSSAEMHTTIYSIAESPLDGNTIWVGTDDGNVQLTRDGGKSWTNVVGNVRGLPRFSWVSWVEASRASAGTAYAAFDRHSFGDMTPWVFRTTDYGKSWARIIGPETGVRGYAHVIKEDPVQKSLLYCGTELGLWISIDAGRSWNEFKGGNFPTVAVRDLAFQKREGDLVIATHGRGIWIIDDLTPLRALTPELAAKDAVFLPGRPVQQRLFMGGGWADGDATYEGQNPPSGAVITYYQRARHMYGPIRIEVVDPQGKVIDALPATNRRGINRVVWSMQVKPPRVPRAASVAFAGSQGPRVVPGTYTIRLTKGTQSIETKVEIGLDRRAGYSVADRKEQFDASMRVHALFSQMSGLMDRLEMAEGGVAARVKALPKGDALVAKLSSLAGKLTEVRKKIVATKEGGAITGEERIREHTDQLYGALLQWEGKPGRYQVERIDALKRELEDCQKELDQLAAAEGKPINEELKTRKLEPVQFEGQVAQAEAPEREVMEAMECWRTGEGCEAPAFRPAERD
ncbi:MAG TPA: hypothetical protein VFA20_05340 [Myxococcaceae bacterium]|nr:hypothetical protein [Myxococcaceae bacterium]